MQKYMEALRACCLFDGVQTEEIPAVLAWFAGRRVSYAKQEYVFHAGDTVTQAGIVLRGALDVLREDFWGNQTILARLGAGDVFAEVFACLPDVQADVSVCAVQPTEVLYLRIDRLLHGGADGCHARLTSNLIGLLARKNRVLNRKIVHLTQRGTRAKLLSYLSDQRALTGSDLFQIPFNRQQLADYLSVDRSALSAELSRLQREGVLEFHKNTFRLLRTR